VSQEVQEEWRRRSEYGHHKWKPDELLHF